jgi:NitT/TauT family transport system substrate-binding protein
MRKTINRGMFGAMLGVLIAAAPASPSLAQEKLTLGLPGVPPIFATVLEYVARDEGLYKKYGVDVTLRQFDSGTVAARAVQTGDIEASLSPTPVIVNMTANAGVDVVAVWGMENTDWLLASMDPKIAKCADVKGQGIGVDTVNGARSVALRELIAPCGLKQSDVQEVPLGSNTASAMVAGQLKVGVLHIDDVPVIEQQGGKKLTTIATMKQVNPVNHYLVIVGQRETIAKRRDAFVRMTAAHIEAARFMKDPKNADRVAQIAAVTGQKPELAKPALGKFLEIDFWPVDNNGLSQKNVEAVAAIQKRTGGIREGKDAVPYDKLIDASIHRDALAMVKAKTGK